MKTYSILALAMVALLVGTSTGGTYSGGTGEPNDPYQIGKVADWQELIGASADWSKHFILTRDIDFGGTNLTPVAPDTDPATNNFQGISFAGVFDGNDHVLHNAVINMPNSDYVGLFGFLDSGGQIRNLGVENIAVTGRDGVGGLCGVNNLGTINACYATGNVTGGNYLGGLCGLNGGTISTCYATGNVTGIVVSWHLGGLCGMNDEFCTISYCYATGAVTGGDNSYSLGGLCGDNNLGTISACYAMGAVTGGNDSYALGGLCGVNLWGTISDCYATGAVTSGYNSQSLGGLCGGKSRGCTFSGCFWDIQTSNCNTSAGGEPKTTTEMKTMSTFTDAGWDFVEIWGIGENQTYPFLRTEPAGDSNHDKKVDLLDLAILASHWLEE